MLTLYSTESSFKKKLTVMVIWLIALSLGILLVNIVLDEGVFWLTKLFPLIIGLFMIAGILLRCKIARGFTLLVLYILALFPLMTNMLGNVPFILLSPDNNMLFSSIERVASNVVWGILFVIPIYFLSNNKSMDIFYIESNPKEHIAFALGAIIISMIIIMRF